MTDDRLVTLTRPHFYEGQVLTDLDLNALIDWVIAKRRLAGLREGWGVVTGLGVRGDSTNVTVTPGYAVTPGGDDIVVEKETSVSTPRDDGVYDVLLTYEEVQEAQVEGQVDLGVAAGSTKQCCEESTPQVQHYAKTDEKFDLTTAPAKPDPVPKAFEDAKTVPADQRKEWLEKLVDENPGDSSRFDPKWIDEPWPPPEEQHFHRLLDWWAAAVRAEEVQPMGPAVVKIARLTVKAGSPVIDESARRRFGDSSEPGGPVNLSGVRGTSVAAATAVLTQRGVVVSEWADGAEPAPWTRVMPGELVRVWVSEVGDVVVGVEGLGVWT